MMQHWIGRLVRVAAVACIIAIVALSLVPGELRPSTGLGKAFEHGMAYCIAAVVLTIAGGPGWRRAALLGLAALAGVLEIGQTFVHGREPNPIDFLASAGGAVAGGALAALVMARLPAALRSTRASPRLEPSDSTPIVP